MSSEKLMKRLPKKGDWLILPQGTCNSREMKKRYDKIFPNALNAGKFDVEDCPCAETNPNKVRRRK